MWKYQLKHYGKLPIIKETHFPLKHNNPLTSTKIKFSVLRKQYRPFYSRRSKFNQLLLLAIESTGLTVSAEMTSTLVSKIYGDWPRRRWARHRCIREETQIAFVFDPNTRTKLQKQMKGTSVKMVVTFKVCSTTKMYGVRYFKLTVVLLQEHQSWQRWTVPRAGKVKRIGSAVVFYNSLASQR